MLKTISRFTSSFAALLTDQNTELNADAHIEGIRTAMLDELSVFDNPSDRSYVWSSIARAVDIQTLWYLRSDLLGVLAESLGEEAAREKISRISEMFRGLVSQNFLNNSGSGPRGRSR